MRAASRRSMTRAFPRGKIEPVANGPMDFTKAKPVGRDFAKVPGGYDHNFVIDSTKPGALTAGRGGPRAEERARDESLDDGTRRAALHRQFSGWLGDREKTGRLTRKTSRSALKRSTTRIRRTIPISRATVLRPGETFRSTTVYEFSAK